MKNKECQVAIIGAGPAGSTAAIQLKRAGIEVILFEEKKIGGLAINANLLENYLGFPQGIEGEKFVKLLEEQLDANVIEVFMEKIQEIKFESEKFIISSEKTQCLSDYLIVATGTEPIIYNIEGSELLAANNLLFYEPQDIPKVKFTKQNIAIIGGGDAAFDYALNLVQKNNKIVIIHRNENFKCLQLLYHRVFNVKDILLKPSLTIEKFELKENNKIEIIFSNKSSLIVDLVMVAIGRKPKNKLINNMPEDLLKNPRLYQIGDLVNKHYRQIAIASSDGLKCAMDITREIECRV
ncbi:MAG: NAD(P)/FAD-dependent oxidoreductase [Candidatus Heimdallarchaeota archaeon]|nr:NAD(P)/FAD-dependent oxidoreductase [Candidatus Heimdallarchaeota archaeon]